LFLPLRIKAILAWDLKNEPNLDFENRDKSNVLSWLEHMITVVKENAPNHLVTIGWSKLAAIHLANKVDFVSYHFTMQLKIWKRN
jgi:endo-1,4-beta-mannosidase